MRLHNATDPEEPVGPPRADEIGQCRVDDDREAVEVLTGTPVEVARVEDRDLGGVPVRAYVPHTAGAPPLGTVVYLHGGGWVFGSLTTMDGVCRRLADRAGMAVLSVAYRLAPEHPWPAAVEDGDAVLAAVAAGAAADLGVDPTRVVVAGDSAGGFLAAALVRRARDAGRPVAGQALVYPVVRRAALDELEDDDGAAEGLSAASMRWFWDQFVGGGGPQPGGGAAPGELDLLDADLAGLPPALVLTAEHDVLCAEGEAYAEALDEAGVEVLAVRLLGLPHGFLRRLTAFAQAGRTIDQIAAWARGTAG